MLFTEVVLVEQTSAAVKQQSGAATCWISVTMQERLSEGFIGQWSLHDNCIYSQTAKQLVYLCIHYMCMYARMQLVTSWS